MPGPLFRNPYFQFLSTNGDGTGTIQMTGNYSVTPGVFFAQAPAGYTFVITHIHFIIGSSTNMNVEDYASIAGGLLNGMLWTYKKSDVVYNAFGDYMLKRNGDYSAISSTSLTNYAGTGQILTCEFDFPKTFTESLKLTGNDNFTITANDDLTTLLSHACALHGRLE